MLLTAASALVVLFVVGVCEAVIGLGIADILTQSNLFKPVREAIGEKLMASYFDDEKPWKMVAFYGISCRMCVSFWIIGIITFIMLAVTGLLYLILLFWMAGYYCARVMERWMK